MVYLYCVPIFMYTASQSRFVALKLGRTVETERGVRSTRN